MEHINFPAQTQDHFISSGKRSERRTWINYLRKIHDTDFREMEAAEEGRTDEPKSLPKTFPPIVSSCWSWSFDVLHSI